MTAEIAILNRTAVALAADSAVTTSYWQDGRRITRYSKGANKIFHVSHKYPVAMMIYGTASLQGLPWEVVLKAYRDARGETAHDKLEGYTEDVFNFFVSDAHLFPKDQQEQQLITSVASAALRTTIAVHEIMTAKGKKIATRRSDAKKAIADAKKKIERAAFIKSVDWKKVEVDLPAFKDRVLVALRAYAFFRAVEAVFDLDELYAMASMAVFKKECTTLPNTGLVACGFGQQEYYPRMIGFECYGILLGQFLYDENSRTTKDISSNDVSDIVPIAQSNMVNTFIRGVNINALVEMDSTFTKQMDALTDKLIADGHLNAAVDTEATKTTLKDAFQKDMNDHLWKEHIEPLRTVVGTLSVLELTDLAETLISLESLKERVTRPSESVSGPIDVAVITKSDGFIWIKRKHYFDRELNPRYFVRRGLT